MLDRRTVLVGLTGLGVGTATFRPALWRLRRLGRRGHARDDRAGRSGVAGLELTEDEAEHGPIGAAGLLGQFAELRKVDVAYDVAPALTFSPVPPRPAAVIKRNQATPVGTARRQPAWVAGRAGVPHRRRAFRLDSGPARWSSIRAEQALSERLKRFDLILKCVVTLTEDSRLSRRHSADRKIARDITAGSLHGDSRSGEQRT